jgi:tRNA uridine 5-carboxymethylaminomethyl modification enzyme
LLREDNADERLTPIGRKLGIVDDQRFRVFEQKAQILATERERLGVSLVRPDDVPAESKLFPLAKESRASVLLRRPDIGYRDLTALRSVGRNTAIDALAPELAEQVERGLEISARYSGYVERQRQEIERAQRYASTRLPPELDYGAVGGLSNEVREKLARIRPESIGQAGRISGMTPAAISLLLIHLKRRAV